MNNLRRGNPSDLIPGYTTPVVSIAVSEIQWNRVLELEQVQRKTTLYIDIDDTIIAQVLPGSGFDLRPCVITQLTVLGRMYDCCWLTSWPYIDSTAPGAGVSVATLMRCLYGSRINQTFRYADLGWRASQRQSRLRSP